MTKSMTGYGKSEKVFSSQRVTVEIRSVNHRHFDCGVKLPREFLFLEGNIKSAVQSEVYRGKVEVFVSIEQEEDVVSSVPINHTVAKAYVEALQEVVSTYEVPLGVTASEILRFPAVIASDTKPHIEIDGFEERVLLVLKEALSDFSTLREQEGERMQRDMLEKATELERLLQKIESKAPQVALEYQKRLEGKVEKLLENMSVDPQRILTEVAIFADKVAIDEEVVRLHSHLSLLRSLLQQLEPAGRKLDFLIQEFNREINTIGSKCNDLEMSHWVVDLKGILEKIREQAQNME